MKVDERINMAVDLLDNYSFRTGIEGTEGNAADRYLWTDAFAVQAFFGLSHILKKEKYKQRALRLIVMVHEHLGRYHPQEKRKGWISGLDEEKGKMHPTIGGLRIGKKLPERHVDESYNSRLEWERDGQYFHYISRWIISLLQAKEETGDLKYALRAEELMLAAGKFIYQINDKIGMYWKMNTELTRALVPSMGAHDPLEGFICAKSVNQAIPGENEKLNELLALFGKLCRGRDWTTSDSLGIGGLLLNALRLLLLPLLNKAIPSAVSPQKLLTESQYSLEMFSGSFSQNQNAYSRLAFRECGLSLGIRAYTGMEKQLQRSYLQDSGLEKYLPMAWDIENFWLDSNNQKAATWTDHLNINAVSLASSLVAKRNPAAFSGIQKNENI